MAEKQRVAAPLCSTCTYHETQSGRINVMWGAGKVLIAVIGVIITILITGQWNNSTKIDTNTARIIKHELEMTNAVNKLTNVLTIMSINQRRHMEVNGVKYITPDHTYTLEYDKKGE